MSRTVVVSGGGTGIGRACAAWFASRGDEVWIVGRRADVLEEARTAMGGTVRAIAADLATAEGAQAVRDALGHRTVDVVVPAAGGTPAMVPVELAEVARDWESDLRANLLTAVLLVEAVRPNLARPGGRIVGIGSIGAQLGSGYGGSYGAAKAGLHAWVFWLAAQLGPEGITANLVLPGYVPETEFFGARRDADFDAVRVARSLVQRVGTPEEVADAVGFLAAPGAGYITGQLLGVNGGMVLGR